MGQRETPRELIDLGLNRLFLGGDKRVFEVQTSGAHWKTLKQFWSHLLLGGSGFTLFRPKLLLDGSCKGHCIEGEFPTIYTARKGCYGFTTFNTLMYNLFGKDKVKCLTRVYQ